MIAKTRKTRNAPIWAINPEMRIVRPILICEAERLSPEIELTPLAWVRTLATSRKTKSLVITVCDTKVDSGPT